MQILCVHGAGGSQQSFQWLREQLPNHPSKCFSYAIGDPIAWSIRRLWKMIDIGKPTIVMGHSLGGVMAVACASLPNVQKLITLNTPFGGIQYAALLSLFSSEPLLRDLNYHSDLLCAIRNTKIDKPHLAIVGTSGSPFFNESNDSVLTVSSQTAMPDARYEKIALNHFEVLLSPIVIDLVSRFIDEV